MKFVEYEKSFDLSKNGESPAQYELFRGLRNGFHSLVWKNSLFGITYKGNVIRISTKGKSD